MAQGSTHNGEKIALFGGSFDPPHQGHAAICSWLLSKDDVDRVWVIPCFIHPFGKEMAPFEDRFGMCRSAFSQFGRDVEVLDVEKQLGGTSVTVRTVEHLKGKYPRTNFTFAVGGDVESERNKWHQFEKLESMIPIIAIPRGPGSHIPDVSATEVRNRVESGQSIAEMVPPSVAVYIVAHKLYQSPKATDEAE
jgi:nicotinate-nucleotide adenylyltransferase